MGDRLAGKVALITGTGGGQGRAAAESFASEGARVVGCDVNGVENERTVETVRAYVTGANFLVDGGLTAT